MAGTPFLVSVADLLGEPGARRVVELDCEIDWRFDPASLRRRLRADLVLENASGTIVARGSVATEAGLTCHRCLREWDEPIAVELTEAFGLEGDDDGYPLDRDEVDLEPVLRDAVLLAVPLRPLCREDCLGLCAVCGADLNTGACPGHPDEEASPFAALRDLLEP